MHTTKHARYLMLLYKIKEVIGPDSESLMLLTDLYDLVEMLITIIVVLSVTFT